MSLALHYWMGDVHHCSGPPSPKWPILAVSSGTLNSTIPYHTFLSNLCTYARIVWPTATIQIQHGHPRGLGACFYYICCCFRFVFNWSILSEITPGICWVPKRSSIEPSGIAAARFSTSRLSSLSPDQQSQTVEWVNNFKVHLIKFLKNSFKILLK